MLDLKVVFGDNFEAQADYLIGKAQNEIEEGDGLGSPWHELVINSTILGPISALLWWADISPDGSEEKAGQSQWTNALQIFSKDMNWGDRFVGSFARGVTFTDSNSVARGQDGEYYTYVGSDPFPKVVSAGINPSGDLDFEIIEWLSAESITDNNGSSVQKRLDIKDGLTVSEAVNYSGIASLLGNRVWLKDRNAWFEVVLTSSVVPNSFDIIQSISNSNYSFKLPYMSRVSSINFGVKDTEDDQLEAFQALLDSDACWIDIEKPTTFYTVSDALESNVYKRTIRGFAAWIKATSVSSPLIRVYGEGSKVEGLIISGNGSYASDYSSTGGSLVRVLADNCTVENNWFTDWKHGIEIRGVSNPTINRNVFLNGLTLPTDDNTESGSAINYRTDDSVLVRYGLIKNNLILGGFGDGITLYCEDSTSDGTFRTGTSTGGIYGVKIQDNYVVDGYTYGIQLYRRGGSATLNILNTEVSGNYVTDITGSTVNANTGDKIYGAGIYNQGAENTSIKNNKVIRCVTETNNDLLTPAGIGSINSASVIIDSNEVFDIGDSATQGGVGIWVKGSNVTPLNAADGFGRDPEEYSIIIKDNLIKGTRLESIAVVDTVETSIAQNRCYDTNNNSDNIIVYRSGGGYFSSEYAFIPSPKVSNNKCKNSARHSVYIETCENAKVVHNNLINPSVDAVRISSCGKGCNISSNSIKSPTGYGVVVLANNNSNQRICGNEFSDVSGGADILCYVEALIGEDNLHTDSTNPIRFISPQGTSNSGFWRFTDGDSTPSVGYLSNCNTENSSATTITNFDNVVNGRSFSVLVTDNNTTFQFSGTNLSGNGGVDYLATQNEIITFTKRGSIFYASV